MHPENGHPVVLEPRPKNEINHLTIASNSLFDAVGAQVLVVHPPARVAEERQLSAAQTVADGLDVAPGAFPHCVPQTLPDIRRDFGSDLPIEAQPPAVLGWRARTDTREEPDEVRLG